MALWLCWGTVALAQNLPLDPGAFHLYLTPADSRGIDFLTHVVEVEITQNPDLTARYDIVSTYWLHNTTDDSRIVDLALHSAAGAIGTPQHGQLQRIQIFKNDIALPLEPLDNGQYQVLIALDPDERTSLDLHYTVQATGRYFPEVTYNSAPLRVWDAPPESMRLSVHVDNELSPRTMQKVTPAPYDLLSGEVRWHFEHIWPGLLQARFMHKAVWNRIRQAEATGDQMALGRQYQILYRVSPEPAARERQAFYDQALAALTQAMAQDPGQAHYSLAQLYRSQLLEGLLPGSASYLELVLHHARRGLNFLPREYAIQRQDLTRWLVDGLEMRIARALQREDWVQVKATLEEVEKLPPGWIAPDRIEAMRRNASLQQALALLHIGAAEEAATLVGSPLEAARQMPPPEAVSLFQSWLIAVMTSPVSLAVTMEGSVDPAHLARLPEKLAELEHRTAQAGDTLQLTWSMQEHANEVPSRRVLQMHLRASDAEQAQRLAMLLGTEADWAPLQQILRTPWSQKTIRNQLLSQDLIYNYTLDLEDSYRLWDAKAQTLEQDAIEEASVGADGPEDAIRQFNYVKSAQAWRDLTANTVVLVALQPNAAKAAPVSDVWAVTVDAPRLQARITRHALHMPRLVGLGFGLLTLLLAFATRLHRLLQPDRPGSRRRPARPDPIVA